MVFQNFADDQDDEKRKLILQILPAFNYRDVNENNNNDNASGLRAARIGMACLSC